MDFNITYILRGGSQQVSQFLCSFLLFNLFVSALCRIIFFLSPPTKGPFWRFRGLILKDALWTGITTSLYPCLASHLILARCGGRGFTIYHLKGWIFLKSPFHKDYVNEGVRVLREGFLYKRLINPTFWDWRRKSRKVSIQRSGITTASAASVIPLIKLSTRFK